MAKENMKPGETLTWTFHERTGGHDFCRYLPAKLLQVYKDTAKVQTLCPDSGEEKIVILRKEALSREGV